MKQPKPTTVDFETFGIEGRPHYPPVPVGVSIKPWGKPAKYYAWGHSDGNNCSYGEAVAALKAAWSNPDGVLMQNAKFDLDVAETHLGLAPPPWDKVHDTLFLLFLDDPHQKELSLKPSADRLLGMAPDERDAVADWLIANQPITNVRITPKSAGAYIAFAPGALVGKYANGDTIRTEALFKLLWPKTQDRKMLVAYDRERQLLPLLLDMERQGVRVNTQQLRIDVERYGKMLVDLDTWICRRLKSATLNIDSGAQLVAAMIEAGKVDVDALGLTATGKPRTDAEGLKAGVTDKQLLGILTYRTQLKTCHGTFMTPWLAMAEKSGGLIFTTWNQVKSPGQNGNIGTRTGRLSSTPNFQNIPKEFKAIFAHEVSEPAEAKRLPKCPIKDLPPLPLVRSYIVPYEKGHLFIDRDYSSQEPRILAHFEAGSLAKQFAADPWTDFHDFAKEQLRLIFHKDYPRKLVKNINLGLIYGQGVGSLAAKNESTVEETKALKTAILSLYPGLKTMYQDMRVRSKTNTPIRTWGGREYYCEPSKIVNGRVQEFDYKLVNVLIQGSAADCTKEAIIRYYKVKDPEARLILQVHDELVVSVPAKKAKAEMEVLRQCMESVEFSVPMLSEGTTSAVGLASLTEYDKRGVITKKA